ncbi:MAG: metallophosphatase family protein [Clostridia bacterium]|nr:metallophosphatase family protein [Clostridia bacterium]
MKRIGVLSDTHIPKKGKVLPKAIIEGLQDVELIVHAGDINKDYVIYELQEIAPVEAVAGNTDDDYMEGLFGRKKVIDIEGYKIGLIHGDGGSGSTLDRVKKAFVHERVSCVVFGHSHIPYCEVIDGILYFNPGSPTDKRRQKLFSYGILRLTKTGIEGEIKYF